MFSGIIEEKAAIKKIAKSAGGARLLIELQIAPRDLKIGDSISVNGACLTIVDIDNKILQFDVMPETLAVTALSEAVAGDIVNIERSLRIGKRISGHFVTGHIDCVGTVNYIRKEPNNYIMEIEVPAGKAIYLADKGSVAVDGISLTIAENQRNYFKVALIPLTLKTTALGSKKKGDKVNVEFDILAKYALRNLKHPASKIDSEFLKKHGFA